MTHLDVAWQIPGGPIVARRVSKSGDKAQFGDRLTDDPPQFDSPRIKHLALLRYLDARSSVVDLARDSWQRLAVIILVRLMVEAERDGGLRQAQLSAHGRRRPSQIVRREWPQTEQFADARRARNPLAVLRHLGAGQRT